MKSFTSAVLIAACFTFGGLKQAAATSGAAQIRLINCVDDNSNNCIVWLSGVTSACSSGNFVVQTGTTGGQNLLKMLQSGYLSGATISFTGTGSAGCVNYVATYFERLQQVQFGS